MGGKRKPAKTAWPGGAVAGAVDAPAKCVKTTTAKRSKTKTASGSVNVQRRTRERAAGAASPRLREEETRQLTASFVAAGWLPCPDDPERFDFPGTSDRNELLRYHRRTVSDGKHRTRVVSCVGRDRATFVAQFVHPLHSFLQQRNGLNTADELQILVAPIMRPTSAVPTKRDGTDSGASWDIFLATNSERTTQADIDGAITGWAAVPQLRVRRVIVIGGAPGRHAEQKLLEFAATNLSADRQRGAFVVGERLPCVACRAFATAFEHVADVAPSHGHFYLSTVSSTPGLDLADPELPRAIMQLLRGRAGGGGPRVCTQCPPDTERVAARA
eukprot:CAMPEP_0174854054 /NCGR_PEP_ID=MMETSP1114-20130205/29835_1 /TAXON_ID=312471 /ORGANISM="Neobodo designis, Strain CCAP 1951/1" /LENGTH=329 /DNA_ID=CAMNT_0016088727 /DNA_START=49 /DNA_END=1038 /DNA_ORIENTATION=+